MVVLVFVFGALIGCDGFCSCSCLCRQRVEASSPRVVAFLRLCPLVVVCRRRTLLSLPWYRGHIDGSQEVMIGYSDSAKDAGRMAAAWAQYNAQVSTV